MTSFNFHATKNTESICRDVFIYAKCKATYKHGLTCFHSLVVHHFHRARVLCHLLQIDSIKMSGSIRLSSDIFVFKDEDACNEKFLQELDKCSYEKVVFGLDCEWVNQEKQGKKEGPVHPVALLQIAFPNKTCFLVRLCKMHGKIPQKVKDVLEDSHILKTGVGISDDVKKLNSCYSLVIQGFVDVRHVAIRCRAYIEHGVSDQGNR